MQTNSLAKQLRVEPGNPEFVVHVVDAEHERRRVARRLRHVVQRGRNSRRRRRGHAI